MSLFLLPGQRAVFDKKVWFTRDSVRMHHVDSSNQISIFLSLKKIRSGASRDHYKWRSFSGHTDLAILYVCTFAQPMDTCSSHYSTHTIDYRATQIGDN